MNKIFDSIRAYFILFFANPAAWGMGLAYLLVYIFFEKSEVSEKEVHRYIQNSDTIILDNFKFIDYNSDKTYLRSYFKKKHANGERGSGTGIRTKEYGILKNLKTNKFFSLDVYDYAGNVIDTSTFNKRVIYAIINSEDLKNPNLGSQKKPIHVLFFYTNKDSKNYYMIEKQYLINVKEYLSYDR